MTLVVVEDPIVAEICEIEADCEYLANLVIDCKMCSIAVTCYDHLQKAVEAHYKDCKEELTIKLWDLNILGRMNMGVRTSDSNNVVLYDSVTGRAFGKVFDSVELANDFVTYVNEVWPDTDVRRLTTVEFDKMYDRYLSAQGEEIESEVNESVRAFETDSDSATFDETKTYLEDGQLDDGEQVEIV